MGRIARRKWQARVFRAKVGTLDSRMKVFQLFSTHPKFRRAWSTKGIK